MADASLTDPPSAMRYPLPRGCPKKHPVGRTVPGEPPLSYENANVGSAGTPRPTFRHAPGTDARLKQTLSHPMGYGLHGLHKSYTQHFPPGVVEAMGTASHMNEISAKEVGELYGRLTQELNKVIVGQDHIVRLLLVSLFGRGHCLLVGVPGLAKTLIVRTLAGILHLSFKRIQFTPDLMPADIIGSEVLQERERRLEYEYQAGPVFANLILADEINRTPPKTQAALLEAMQEHRVTI